MLKSATTPALDNIPLQRFRDFMTDMNWPCDLEDKAEFWNLMKGSGVTGMDFELLKFFISLSGKISILWELEWIYWRHHIYLIYQEPCDWFSKTIIKAACRTWPFPCHSASSTFQSWKKILLLLQNTSMLEVNRETVKNKYKSSYFQHKVSRVWKSPVYTDIMDNWSSKILDILKHQSYHRIYYFVPNSFIIKMNSSCKILGVCIGY